MRRLSTKIFLVNLGVILLLAILVIFFSYSTIKNYYFDDLYKNLKSLNLSLQYQVKDYYKNGEIQKLDSLVKEVGNSISTRITIVDNTGIVIADSDFNPSEMDNHSERPEIKMALDGDFGKVIRYSSTVDDDMIYVALPLIIDGEMFGVIRVSILTSVVYDLLHLVRQDMFEGTSIVIILTLIGALIFTRRLIRPINQLSVAAANVASGDFDYQVKVQGNDEITQLAKNFNLMIQRIKELFIKVNSQREELGNLISSIDEGFVVLSQDGKIILSNNKFNDIVETEQLEGRKIKKVIKEKGLNQLFKDTKFKKKSITKEIVVKDRTLLASSNLITSKNEIAILFHDVTELKQFEQIKKDFVINVSHELRTPLTAIKGFIETLHSELEDNPTANHYIKIISRHTNRLIDLVQDLLTLSELEDGGTKLQLSEFNIEKFVTNVLKIFDHKLKDKSLKAKIISNLDKNKIQADKFRLEQLFINLIDNSIKYTDKGNITIHIHSEQDYFHLIIEDTGIGINREHLDRIFERFYLVNKSRTRKEGGTGLGLSIVKHIVLQHKGTIKVESEIGKGTKFFVKLPILQDDFSEESDFGSEVKLEKVG